MEYRRALRWSVNNLDVLLVEDTPALERRAMQLPVCALQYARDRDTDVDTSSSRSDAQSRHRTRFNLVLRSYLLRSFML